MKKSMKKFLAVFFVIAMSIGTLSACSTGTSTPSSSAAATTAAATSTAGNATAVATTTAPSGKRVPITIFTGDFGRIVKEDNPVVEQVGIKTGTVIKMSIIPASEYIQKLNLYISSDTLPDIVRFAGYDSFRYVSSGALLEISGSLSKYPQLYNSQPKEAWDLVTVQGKIYTVPNYNVPGKYSYYMRQDWLDKLSLKAPTNLEELRTVLKAFTNNDPDGNGKKDTWGLGTMSKVTSVKVNPFMQIFGAYGIQPYAFYQKDGKAYNPLLSNEYKMGLEYCRMLYVDDKVVDPDVFIIPEDEAQQRIVQGRIGSARGWWADICERINDQLKMPTVTPSAKWSIVNTIKGPNGDYGMLGNDITSFSSSISAKSKNIDKCYELLNFIGSDEGFMLTSYGIKDKDYTVDTNGKFVARTPAGTEAMNAKWLDVLSQFVYRVKDYQKILITASPTYEPYLIGARDGKLYMNIFEGINTDVTQKYLADLDKVALDWFVKFVTGGASLDQFDAFVKEYKSKGGDAIMESYLTEYNARKGTKLVAGN